MSRRAGEIETPIDEIVYLNAELFCKRSILLPNAELLLIDKLKANSGDQWRRFAQLRPSTAE